MGRCFSLFLLLLCSWNALYGEVPSRLERYQEVQQEKALREERVAITGNVLYLHSSLTNTFSDQVFLLDNLNPSIRIFDKRAKSVNPGYDFGYALHFLYQVSPSRHDLKLDYHYLLSKGSGVLNRDNQVTYKGITQRNRQNDRGALHSHTHIFDFLVAHRFPVLDYLLLEFFGGLTFTDFHYLFTFSNADTIWNVEGGETTQEIHLSLDSVRKFRFLGIGPKFGVRFGYHFFPNTWPHAFFLYSSFRFSPLFAKKWGSGTYEGSFVFDDRGSVTTNSMFPLRWEDELKARFISHMEVDFSARYRYLFAKSNISMAIGFKVFGYWGIEEVNRIITYNLETVAPVLPRGESDVASMIFSGLYTSLTYAF